MLSKMISRRIIVSALEEVHGLPILVGFPSGSNSAIPYCLTMEAEIARAYSQDLRERVIASAEAGLPARHAAARFGVGIATAIVWVRRARETGERKARRQGQPRRSKLDPHGAYLQGLIDADCDITLAEMQTKLLEEHGLKAAVGTLWKFLDRRGLTVKKRPRTQPSRTAPTSRSGARRGSRTSPVSTRSA